MTAASKTSALWAAQSRANFREDYREMRSWGLTHDQIAAKLGIKKDSLFTRCRRAGVFIAEPTQETVRGALDALIAAGKPFTAEDLPPLGSGMIGGSLLRAIRAGRIRSVGTVPHPRGGHRLHVWVATGLTEVAA